MFEDFVEDFDGRFCYVVHTNVRSEMRLRVIQSSHWIHKAIEWNTL